MQPSNRIAVRPAVCLVRPCSSPVPLPQSACAVAHHVQKKAAKHHEHTRPRKSRPSDINRKVPEYPPMVFDVPCITQTDGASTFESKKVTITVAPSDSLADLNSKLEGAGASAVERFVYGGQELATTLADCGLTEETSVEAETRVYAAA